MSDAPPPRTSQQHDETPIGTVQSLIVAFVLAMTFRGFVTEGFVIPTGSMAPTLLGQHVQLHSQETGWEFAAGVEQREAGKNAVSVRGVPDPMLGPKYAGTGSAQSSARVRAGDRILVLKCLYPFSMPNRFDVVVFKNPTEPNGEAGNYIKRLIGLPNESIWLADGDVFVGSSDSPDEHDQYAIARKPDHVQRAVWQPIYRSDFLPLDESRLVPTWQDPWLAAQGWSRSAADRYQLRTETDGQSVLEWDNHVRRINDWAPYNTLFPRYSDEGAWNSNDIRVAASLVPDHDGLSITFDMVARAHVYRYTIANGSVSVKMRSVEYDEDDPSGWKHEESRPFDSLSAGKATEVEFWHADQQMSIFINGKLAVRSAYEWTPIDRLEHATRGYGQPATALSNRPPAGAAQLRWTTTGSAATMHQLQVDRDLYYRTDAPVRSSNPTLDRFKSEIEGAPGFATSPENLGVLNSEQYMMLGDNSTASSDSRVWGSPHPTVAVQIDPSPFVVNRRLLLGKAWVVYFPATLPISERGSAFIPDFGQLRFIR